MDPQPLNPDQGNAIPQNPAPVSRISVETLRVLWDFGREIPDEAIPDVLLGDRSAVPGGGDFAIEKVKAAFELVGDKSAFLQAAFQRIALPENEENAIANIRILLELFRDKVDPETIIEAFCNSMAAQFEAEFDAQMAAQFEAEFDVNRLFKRLFKRLGMLAKANEPEIISFGKELNAIFILARLMLADKLPSLDLRLEANMELEQKILRVLFRNEEGAVLLARLMANGKIHAIGLNETEVEVFVSFLFKKNEIVLLARLMDAGFFPRFKFSTENFPTFIRFLSEDGERAVLLARLMDANKLPSLRLAKLPKEESEKLFNTLSSNEDGAVLLARLILANKLPNLELTLEKCRSLFEISIEKKEMGLFARLILADKLPNFTLSSELSQTFATFLLEDKDGAVLLPRLILANKLPNLELTPEKCRSLFSILIEKKEMGLFARLILADKLPNLELTSKECRLLSRILIEKKEMGLFVRLILADKLPNQALNQSQSTTFARSLLRGSKDAVDGLIALIDRDMLPNLDAAEEVKAHAIWLQGRHAVFQTAITEAFGDIRQKQGLLEPKDSRRIWQAIANKIAADCFEKSGKVDDEKLEIWRNIIGNEEIFKEEPYSFIPHTEFVRSQMYAVCESLIANKNEAKDRLNAAKDIAVGTNGKAILGTMSQGRQPLLSPAIAILASLFTPHRQQSLPACTIYARINAEIWNHPERLILIYRQMLETPQFTLPSGYAILPQPMRDGPITVDLKNGGQGKERVFRDIDSGNPSKIQWQKNLWDSEGIGYAESTEPEEKYRLTLPIHNMNDALFAHIFQESFGKEHICHDDINYGIALLYAGHLDASKEAYPNTFKLRFPRKDFTLLDIIKGLREQAEIQKGLGNHRMRISIQTPQGGHSENIDIDALLAIDPDTMEPGRVYSIGDLNYYGKDPSQDIPRRAIKRIIRTGGSARQTPTSIYEIGLLDNGIFESDQRDRISIFRIYNTDIEVRSIEYWEQLRQLIQA
ncbi:MAG: hypothetical protein LBC30_03485 [Puniceicoccales bacterium]|jgi:hypothetical protein|nr:hypothetical protein [Puniceicoccales bacterium]